MMKWSADRSGWHCQDYVMRIADRPPSDFEFFSSIGVDFLADLESLLFFHPRQEMLVESIRDCVAQFGTPEIQQRAGRLYVDIPANGAQGLIACHRCGRDGSPVGVAVYLRTSRELLRILHLAVQPDYERGGRHAALGLSLLLIDEVLGIARRIAGIRRIQLPYQRDAFLAVPRLSTARWDDALAAGRDA